MNAICRFACLVVIGLNAGLAMHSIAVGLFAFTVGFLYVDVQVNG